MEHVEDEPDGGDDEGRHGHEPDPAAAGRGAVGRPAADHHQQTQRLQ